jgi:hypothetical protein
MAYSIIDDRAAATVKEILRFAKSFVFKDADQADAYESTTSILWGSYFISACEGTLPFLEKYGRKGFPNAQFTEYNIIPNGVELYFENYLKNSLYIGNSNKRLQEVREATTLQNVGLDDAPFCGNIFEANLYYRLLFCQYGVEPNVSRQTPDHGILYYDSSNYYLSDTETEIDADGNEVKKQIRYKYLDKVKFLKLYAENRNLFVASMENRAMRWDPNYTTFVNWMIVLMTIMSYLDSDLEKIYNVDLFNQYDIRNALYSFGITFLDDLPSSYQLRVIKNLRELVRTKSTSETLRIVIKDIFGRQVVDAYKLYIVYGDPNLISKGTSGSTESGDRELFFVKIPFDVTNVKEYLIRYPDTERLDFTKITENDKYWSANCDATKVKELLERDFGDGLIIVPSKYIGISNDLNIEEQNDGALLLFALLHYIQPSAVSLPRISGLNLGPTPLLYAMLGLFYLETAIGSMNTGDMKPNWNTQPSIYNVIGKDDTAWHILSFIMEIDSAIPEKYQSVLFGKATTPSGTLWSEVQNVKNLINTITNATSLSSALTSILRVFRELKKIFFFVADAPDAISGPLVSDNSFLNGAISSGIQTIPATDADKTITQQVFENLRLPYPLEGQVEWDGGDVRSYSREGGFTEFTESKILREIYEDVFLKSNKLPSAVYSGAATVEDFLRARAPLLFGIITDALEEGIGSARSVLAYLATEISNYLQSGGLEEGAVDFEVFSKGYLAEFASLLVEKFVSYTVQLQISGSKLKADGIGDSFVGFYDHLSKTGQHLLFGDSFYGLADREQTMGESEQINPPEIEMITGPVSPSTIPTHDELAGMFMYEQVVYHPDIFGVVGTPFGVIDTGLHNENWRSIWKWDGFKTRDDVLVHIVQS